MHLVSDSQFSDLTALLKLFSLNLKLVEDGADIPGSFWGESEAGIIGSNVFVRNDTPTHSFLHEACHSICMSDERRAALHTDAGGEFEEENAVCYLQILMAEKIPQFSGKHCMDDMDTWGYTFRLGSTQRWFEEDATDALEWLKTHRAVVLTKIRSQI